TVYHLTPPRRNIGPQLGRSPGRTDLRSPGTDYLRGGTERFRHAVEQGDPRIAVPHHHPTPPGMPGIPGLDENERGRRQRLDLSRFDRELIHPRLGLTPRRRVGCRPVPCLLPGPRTRGRPRPRVPPIRAITGWPATPTVGPALGVGGTVLAPRRFTTTPGERLADLRGELTQHELVPTANELRRRSSLLSVTQPHDQR